jgi:hypothetical protein
MNSFINGRGTRRSFFGHAGAALAAPLAATAALGGERDGCGYGVGRLAALENMNAIRALQQRYVRLVGTGNGEAMAALFADRTRAAVDEHVRSLVPVGDDTIAIFSDGTATARVPCTATIATPIESWGTLVEMARLQGEGFVTRSERRTLATTFVRRDGSWKIERVELEA